MAEIRVERKDRAVWPWVLLGLILLAVLLWWLFAAADDDTLVEEDAAVPVVATEGGDVGTITAPAGAPAAVVAFVTFANENRARQAADTSHEFTAEGIRTLARALGAMADRQPALAEGLRQHVDSMGVLADQLEQNWQSTAHADYARRAFMQATMVMQRLQEQVYTGAANQVAQVRQAAEAIQGNQTLLNQRAEIQRFFDRAAEALNAMTV